MSARKRLWLTAGWVEVIFWIVIVVPYAILTRESSGADFGVYYAAAETLRFSPHSDIYLLQTLSATVNAHGGCAPVSAWPSLYAYQPLFALLLQPLTLIPCQSAAMIWLALNLALWFGVAGAYALHARRQRGSFRALLVAMMVVFFAPILAGISYGQIHLVMLVIVIVGMALIKRDRELAGGAVLGFGAVLKYFPAFLVFYYLLRGRWRAALGAAAISIVLGIIEWLIVGPRTLLESIGAAEGVVRERAATYESGHWMSALPGGILIGYLAATLFFAAVVWLRWGKVHQLAYQPANELLGAGWALVTVLMLSPLVWWFDITRLLPALVACFDVALRYAREAASGRGWRAWMLRWWPVGALAVCYGLLLSDPGELHSLISENYLTMATGTLLLWLLCGALYLWSAGVRLPSGWSFMRWRSQSVPAFVTSERERALM